MLGAKRSIKRRVQNIGPSGEIYNHFNWYSKPKLYKKQTGTSVGDGQSSGCCSNTNNTNVINKSYNSFINNRKSLYCYEKDCSEGHVVLGNLDIYKEPFEAEIGYLQQEKNKNEETLKQEETLIKLRYDKAKRHIQNRRGVRNTNYNYTSKQYLERRQKALNKNVLGLHKLVEYNKSYVKEIGGEYFVELKNYIPIDPVSSPTFYKKDVGYEMKLYDINKNLISQFYIDDYDKNNLYSTIYPTINIIKKTYKGVDLQTSDVKTFNKESFFIPTSVCFEIDENDENGYKVWFNGYVLKNTENGCKQDNKEEYSCNNHTSENEYNESSCGNSELKCHDTPSTVNKYMAGYYIVHYYSINKYNLHCGWDNNNYKNKKGYNQCNVTNDYNRFIIKERNPQFSKNQAVSHGERLKKIKYQEILKSQNVVSIAGSNNGSLTYEPSFVFGKDINNVDFREPRANAVNGDYPVSLYRNTFPNYKKHLSGLSTYVGCHGKKNERQRCVINDCLGPCLCSVKQILNM